SLTSSVEHIKLFSRNVCSLTLPVTARTGLYPYTTLFRYGFNETTKDISGLTYGTYQVVVKDANSCEAYGTFTIAQPEQLVITPVVENVKCFGGNDGSISLTVTGGTGDYQYSWTGPNGFNETTKDITSLTYG